MMITVRCRGARRWKTRVVVQFESFRALFTSFTDRHLKRNKRARILRGPIRARFWREWADQRASSPEGPYVCFLGASIAIKIQPSLPGLVSSQTSTRHLSAEALCVPGYSQSHLSALD